jgi:hypothetical protein
VGSRFRLPFAGPVPAGVYRSTDRGCDVTLELFQNGQWTAVGFRGELVTFPGPGRNLAARPGTPACIFERTL